VDEATKKEDVKFKDFEIVTKEACDDIRTEIMSRFADIEDFLNKVDTNQCPLPFERKLLCSTAMNDLLENLKLKHSLVLM
jgi:hypothetical protein